MTSPARRPVTVTVATALVYAGALLDVGFGIVILLSRYDARGDDAVLAVSLLGAGVILLGLLSLAVAGGLARGSRLSRGLVTGYVAVRVALQVVALVSADAWDAWSLIQIAVEVVVVVALWTPPGSRWFRRPPAQDPSDRLDAPASDARQPVA